MEFKVREPVLDDSVGPIHYRYEIEEVQDTILQSAWIDVEVTLSTFAVVAETPKGYWLTYWGHSKDVWVSKDSMKRWAYPTKKEAICGFLKRKRKYIRILKHQLQKTEMAIPIAEEILDGF